MQRAVLGKERYAHDPWARTDGEPHGANTALDAPRPKCLSASFT